MFSNNDKQTVVITGASSGFGRAAALKFSANRWNVIALARREEKLQTLQEAIGEENCFIQLFDVTKTSDITQFVELLKHNQIKVDLLVNNAGLALGLSSADKALESDWSTMLNVNIQGLISMTRALLPSMVAAKSGHIINIGSIAGSYAYPGGNTYGASKAFVAQFSRNLRADLAGTHIRVTNIEPGLAETEFSIVRFHGDKTKADSVYDGVEPLQADDIAEAIFWSANQPKHVNINSIELMPTCQSFAPLTITRSTD